MNVAVIGSGRMGSQIGCEYALAGHDVVFVARRPDEARRRVADALDLVVQFDLAPATVVNAARARMRVVDDIAESGADTGVVVESIVEDIQAKGEVLAAAGRQAPLAILATNTSSLSITALGEAAGAPTRTVGVHYWNPPLLMPLVEVIAGERTDRAVVDRMLGTLRAMGKRPVVGRDVPGFIWNRLQLALLREAAWIVERGVATPAAVDEVVRDGLARRWRMTGPFETAALGGVDTFTRIAANLFPVLSVAGQLDDLGQWLDADPDRLEALRVRRDAALADDLHRDRNERDEPSRPSSGDRDGA